VPELPEVETTLRGIAPFVERHQLIGWTIRNPSLRWPVEIPANLKNQPVVSLRRRGKYILLEFKTGALLVHLGMSGSLRCVSRAVPYLDHDHVELDFGGDTLLRLNDPRRFGSVLWQSGDVESHRLLAHLGPEPLGNEFSASYMKGRALRRKIAIKTFLMDSSVVVGVGNIYANEALFLSGIRPARQVARIPLHKFEDLTVAVRRVLSDAITLGGTTLRDFVSPDGRPGYFRQQLRVYDRKGQECRICGEAIVGVVLGGRGTFYCPVCQPARGFGRLTC
jgi:formamidopyrimidine-DNA glycosylase